MAQNNKIQVKNGKIVIKNNKLANDDGQNCCCEGGCVSNGNICLPCNSTGPNEWLYDFGVNVPCEQYNWSLYGGGVLSFEIIQVAPPILQGTITMSGVNPPGVYVGCDLGPYTPCDDLFPYYLIQRPPGCVGVSPYDEKTVCCFGTSSFPTILGSGSYSGRYVDQYTRAPTSQWYPLKHGCHFNMQSYKSAGGYMSISVWGAAFVGGSLPGEAPEGTPLMWCYAFDEICDNYQNINCDRTWNVNFWCGYQDICNPNGTPTQGCNLLGYLHLTPKC